jgi:predicted PurR-regulated permease PerM
MTAERVLMAILIGGIAVGCWIVLYPFISALLWAAILTFTTWPVYEWLRQRLRINRAGAAGIMVFATAVIVVLPLALAAPGGADDVNQLEKVVRDATQAGLPNAPDWLGQLPVVGPRLAEIWNTWAADLSAMVAFFQPYFGIAAQFVLSLLLGLASGVLQFLLALFVAFFFFAWGEQLAARIQVLLRRIAGARADRLIEVTGGTVRGVVYGLLGTAVVQGLLTVFGLWVAGVPRPALLGVIAGGMSVLPIGAPAVWIPAAIWLMTSGHMLPGVGLLIYGAVFVSGADYIIRPYFIVRAGKLPVLLSVLGVLGGALAFGLLGIFLGPVLLGMGFALMNEWASEDERAPSGPPTG